MKNLLDDDNLFRLACEITRDHRDEILRKIEEEKRALENQDVEIQREKEE